MDDHTIVAGLGCHQGLEEDEGPLDLTGPQATSTVAAKMTREQLNRQYLQTLQEASEGSLEEFRSLRSTLRGENRGSSGMGVMMALPLIDTAAMSGLSSSKFLVDHTQLYTAVRQNQEQEQLQGENRSQDRSDLHSDVPCEEKKLQELGQGEVRELLPYDTMESETGGELAGLPSALLEPQGLLLDQDQEDLEGGGIRNLTAITAHLARTGLEHDEFSTSQVQFDASQISARSTIHEGSHRALEASKLLSNSCNSLGSIEGLSDPFLTHQQNAGATDEDWLEAHQGDLAEMMKGEEFQSPSLLFFEEEERKHHEENKFCVDMAPHSSKPSLDLSCFSGIHGVAEITVRPSWIGSPEKELLGPNNHMLVDDYLQARSEALGTLGASKDPSNRPNFGKEVHSPPTSMRNQPLVDMSADENTMFDGSESSMKQDSSASSTACASGLSKGSREDTLMSEGRRASPTTTPARNQKGEETIGMKVVHEVEELEASIHTVRQPLEASTISSLLTRALATNAPHDLVDRILRLTQESSVPPSSLETTGLDASLEVMELRQLREDMVRQKQGGSKSSHLPGKENRGKENRTKFTCNPNRKPLQSMGQPGQHPLPALSHKHMKLKAVRTTSDPGIPPQTCQEKDESDLEETLQGAQYMSNFVDDSEKLMLPSFNQSGAAVKSSTPCFPHNQILVSDSLYSEPPASATSNHRALPRMGLRSSTKASGRMPELGVSASGADGAIESQCRHPIKSYVSQGGEVGLRTTTSSPVNMSTRPTTITTNAHARPHHPKDISQPHTNSISVSVPHHVILPEACVVGMATYTTLPLQNPSSRWLQVSLKLMKETLDGSVSMASVLLFQTSYFLEPQGRCDVRLGVCCPVQGQLEAQLEVQVGELTASGTCGTSPSTHTMLVKANITMPEVEVQFEGGHDCLDLGVVGESCCLSHTVTLTNHCPQPLPLLLHLQQMTGEVTIFCWEEDKNKAGKVVSASHLSCELAPSTPTTFSLTLRAPHLDGVSGIQNGRVQVGSFLKVLLDTPAPTSLTLASHPIKAFIGVVQLEILRTHEPLVVDANPHQSGTTHLTLKNASSFPLHISLSIKDDTHAFSLHPFSLSMPPGARSSPALLFTPGTYVGTLNSVLVLRVEPDGMEFEIAVSGVSHVPSQSSSVSASPAPAPISASVSAPPVHSTHKQVQKIHASLTKSSSAPLSKMISSSPPLGEKILSSALESTKSRLVFGTVAVGATSSQKLVLRNNLTTRKLPLCVTIIGSQAFQVCASGSEAGQEKLDAVLQPCEELVLSVLLQPSSVEPLSATLVCRHRSSSDPFKWKIPLQGYGGRGELLVKGSNAGKAFIFKDLSLGLPTILQTSVTNTGHRTLFLVLHMFSDKQCKEPATDFSMQPTRLVVGPGETHDVHIVASGTPRQLARTPGIIGVLQAISGEEILRQRYQRMKNKEVKARRINKPDLLKLNWMQEFTGEQKAQQEPDILPPQPEDAVVFFNACTITQVEIWGEQRPNEDHSSTVFACLAGEQTLADLTTTNIERVDNTDSPPTQSSTNLLQPSPAASWDVLPQALSMQFGDTSPQVFFVVNFTSTQQMLEISSSCNWLEIEPREAVLLGHSSVRLCVTACPPHILTSPVIHSLKVMGENESRSAKITILPATKETSKTHIKASQSLPASVTDPLPVATKQAPSNPHHIMANTLQPVTSAHQPTTTSNLSSQSQPHQAFSATSTAHCQNTAAISALPLVSGMKSQSNVRETQGCLIQLVSDDVTFPDTHTTQETYVKVMLRNLDKIVHSVQAEVTHGPFMVRHTQFTIKAGHYVNVPVYFRPQKMGLCTGYLRLTVLKDKLVLPVHLSGQALP